MKTTSTNWRHGLMGIGGLLIASSLALVGCAGDAGTSVDGADEATSSAGEAIRTSLTAHCTKTTHVVGLGNTGIGIGPKVTLRGAVRWDTKNARIAVYINQRGAERYGLGPHSNLHVSLYDKNGGWVSSYDSPDNIHEYSRRRLQMDKKAMKPRPGDRLDVQFVFDIGGHDWLRCTATLHA